MELEIDRKYRFPNVRKLSKRSVNIYIYTWVLLLHYCLIYFKNYAFYPAKTTAALFPYLLTGQSLHLQYAVVLTYDPKANVSMSMVLLAYLFHTEAGPVNHQIDWAFHSLIQHFTH